MWTRKLRAKIEKGWNDMIASRVSAKSKLDFIYSGFYTFAASCCQIQRMDLEECLNITDDTLLQLSIHCPHLKG